MERRSSSKDVVAQAADILRRASDAGFGLIVDLEYSHGDALQAVAKDYASTDYVILNQVRPGANVASVLFQEQEGSYLAGALATMVAMDPSIKGMSGKPVIGVIGGTKSVGIDKFIVGYIEGAREIEPKVEVKVAYSNNFGDPTVGFQMAKAMFDAGANVVYQVAGGTGLGVIKAAKQAGKFAIGVDTDQDGIAPGSVLTSMVKHTDIAVETVMKDYAENKFPGGKTVTLGLEQDGVGLSPMKYTHDIIPAAMLAKVQNLKEEDTLRRHQGLERRRSGLPGLLQVIANGRAEVRIGARGVTRRFDSVLANDRIDLSVAPATIHAVVGGNGAGKSTLMRILQGVDHPDEGSVILDDRPVRLTGPADAYERGIGMVHQEFMLAPLLTLLENLVLAREPIGFGGLIDWRAAQAEADRLAKIAGATIDWRLRVVDAPVHVRQALEILRLLYRGADVLILDEPTAVLAPAQIEDLLALMRKLKAEGRTILFISHKLEEVMSVADAITIMRGGRVVETTTPANTSLSELARAMIGEAVEPAKIEPRARRSAEPLFRARGLVGRDRMGVKRLGPVDVDIFGGEIVGVAGVSGNGQDELVGSAAGLTPPAEGTIAFAGVDMTQASTSDFRAAGIGYLSADRAEEGLCQAASIRDNFIAGRERERSFSRYGVLRLRVIAVEAERALSRLSVRYGRLGIRQAVSPAATSSVSPSRVNSTESRDCLSPPSRRAGSTLPGLPSFTSKSPRFATAAAPFCWFRNRSTRFSRSPIGLSGSTTGASSASSTVTRRASSASVE